MSSVPAVPFSRACSFAAALALVACSPDMARGPLAPAAPALAAASVPLPFRGTLETMRKSFTPLGPTTALVHAEGTGTATHLGRYAIAIDLTVDFATLSGIEAITLTAANGDVLTATATTHASPNADGVTLSVVETVTITGGTGRFSGATGNYVVHCVSNQATGVSVGSFTGAIWLH